MLLYESVSLISMAAAAAAAAGAVAPPVDVPLHPLRVASSWPQNASSAGHDQFRYGDIRAAVSVAAADLHSSTDGGPLAATVQVYWRRRDPNLNAKLVVVTDAAGRHMAVVSAHIERSCGVLTFEAGAGPATYFVYYLPYVEKGGGARLAFHWWNCSDQADRRCITTTELAAADPSQCTAAAAGVSTVVALESRDEFHSFQAMEMIAVESEVAAVVAASHGAPFAVFAESHARPVRMFDYLPAPWARNGSKALNGTAAPGSFFVFQIGVFAHTALPSVTLEYGAGLRNAKGDAIEPTAFRCFNLGGIDAEGKELQKQFSIPVETVGALWIGVDIPDTAIGVHTGSIAVRALGHTERVTLSLAVRGAAVDDHGAGDVYSMARLRWLDSTIGSNESDIPAPFTPVTVNEPSAGAALALKLLHRTVQVGPNGLPTSVQVAIPRVRRGRTIAPTTELLEGLAFDVLLSGGNDRSEKEVLPMAMVSSAKIVKHTDEGAAWQATLRNSQTGLTATVAGLLEFDSYLEMNVSLTAGQKAVDLADVLLRITPQPAIRRYMFGLAGDSGTETGLWSPLTWRWSNTTGNNLVWGGVQDGGIFLKIKGDGDAWNNPLYGKDFPVVPFVPRSWGGVSPDTNPGGINVTETEIVAFCGRQMLKAGESLTFLFDLAFTPSKPVDMVSHYQQRYLQLGYGGVPYMAPKEVKARGATVMTLHQGIKELVNAQGEVDSPPRGGLVNPYINYPFNKKTVATLTAISEQAHASGLAVKYLLRPILVYQPKELNRDSSPRFSTLWDKNGWI